MNVKLSPDGQRLYATGTLSVALAVFERNPDNGALSQVQTLYAAEIPAKEDFIAFLEHLLTVYVEVPIILIVDNYSSHTAYLVRDWLALHPQLQRYYLPKYCSDLNPVENIWLRLKNKVAANRLYGSFQLLLDAVDRFFREMTPEQALV